MKWILLNEWKNNFCKERKINSIIGITKILSMLKKIKNWKKLEGNLMDFKREKSFCPKSSAGTVANKDISGHIFGQYPSLINKENLD